MRVPLPIRPLLLVGLVAMALSTPPSANAEGRTRVPARTGLARTGLNSTAGPVLQAHCVRCHGATEASGGLRLDSYDAIMRGGERGPVVVPGLPQASLLIQKVLRRDKPAMPPRTRLREAEIRKLASWIKSGASP